MGAFWRVGKEELAYVEKAIESGLKGNYIEEFEHKFAELTDAKYAISVNSGTTALAAAAMALELGEGDEVLVPSLTFSASGFTPLFVNATPVFVDANPDTFLIDVEDMKKKITAKTKAIIIVSLYGLIPNMEEILKLCKEHNLKLIEDNAQSMQAYAYGKQQGSFGDITIYSLQRSKHLTTGDGGVVTTNDEKLAKAVRQFADLGYSTLKASPGSHLKDKNELQHPSFLRHELIGLNYRMPEVCAAMGLAQIEKAKDICDKRKAIGKIYEEVAAKYEGLITRQKTPETHEHSYWAFCFVLNPEKVSWEDFRAKFMELGGHQYYGCWQLAYLEPALRGKTMGSQTFETGLCPNAERFQKNMVQLKTNFETLEQAGEQAKILNQTLESFV